MAKMGGRNERRNGPCSEAGSYQRGSNLLGWPDSGVLDATGAVVAYGTQGLNHPRLEISKTRAVLAGLIYGAAVYFFMNYLVLPLSAVATATCQLGLFLNGVIRHAVFVGLPIAHFARTAQ